MIGIVTNLVIVTCIAGCTKGRLRHQGRETESIEQNDTITIVLDYAGGSLDEAKKLETRLSESVQEALHDSDTVLRLIPPDEFRRLVFPGLDITSTPRSTASLALLMKAPKIRQKIDSLRLRYLVSVKEETFTRRGSGFTGYAPAPGGVSFLATYKKRTNLKASIIDMKNASEKDVVDIDEKSTGIYGLVVIPFFIPAATELEAIQRFGREVVKCISFDKK